MFSTQRLAGITVVFGIVALCLELTGSVATAWADAAADCKRRKEHPHLALSGCSLQMERTQRDAKAFDNRGVANGRKGDEDPDFTNAITLDPALVNSFDNRGIVYERKGDEDPAIADHTKAIELDPTASTSDNRGVAFGRFRPSVRFDDDESPYPLRTRR
jgi:hypothetical protein